MLSAIRSFTEPPGLLASSLPRTSATPSGTTLCSRTSGVRPIRSRTESAISGLPPTVASCTASLPQDRVSRLCGSWIPLDRVAGGERPQPVALAISEISDGHRREAPACLVVDVTPDPLLPAQHGVLVSIGRFLEAGERRQRALEALEGVQQANLRGR